MLSTNITTKIEDKRKPQVKIYPLEQLAQQCEKYTLTNWSRAVQAQIWTEHENHNRVAYTR